MVCQNCEEKDPECPDCEKHNSAVTVPDVRLRYVHRPDIWRRLSLLEKIAVIQAAQGLVTLLLLIVLVFFR
jgi:hypothetical protein